MEPFLGEIRMFAGNFAPAGWMFCQGQTLSPTENESLFNLIGTTYGGDGQATFCLPDLQGRVPIHTGGAVNGVIGQKLGVENVTLTVQQIPAHNHALLATRADAISDNPQNELVADVSPDTFYADEAPSSSLASQAVSMTGGSQQHNNMMPYVALNYIISLFGIFPEQT